MRRFLQVTLYPISAHTGKNNEILTQKKYPSVQKKKWKGPLKGWKDTKPKECMELQVFFFIKLGGGGGGGGIVLTYLTNILNNILKTKQIPDSWHEAK